MSRVLKSSQVILDEDKYKLPHSITFKKKSVEVSDDNSEKQVEKDVEMMIAEKMEEIDKLYETARANAHEEADKIICEAYEKSKGIKEQARQEGFLEGKNEGFKEGKNEADSIIEEALVLKRKIEKDKKSAARDLEKEVIELTISTIEKILNRKIEEEHDTIQSLIGLGLEKCAFTEDLIVRVSPEDYDFAVSIKDKILALSQGVNDIAIKQDISLAKGSCIIDSSSGSIDSSIWTQFSQVKEIFEELLRSE